MMPEIMSDTKKSLESLSTLLQSKHKKIAVAESCTGGFLAATITSLAGSSLWFERGFVTYSNESKQEMLGVSPGTLERFGAVSEQVATEMAQGALHRSHADLTVSITGIAGPDGGTPEKPVGTVCFGLAAKGVPLRSVTMHFSGERHDIRAECVRFASQWMMECASAL